MHRLFVSKFIIQVHPARLGHGTCVISSRFFLHLERERSQAWVEDNAVRFETSKTETIIFSRKRAHRRCDSAIR